MPWLRSAISAMASRVKIGISFEPTAEAMLDIFGGFRGVQRFQIRNDSNALA